MSNDKTDAQFGYCEQVYQINPTAIEPLIDALATHQYIYTPITNSISLNTELATWQQYLDEFVKWADGHGWQAKPLYLTEYGDFENPCPPQVSSQPSGSPRCGEEADGYAFWGGHYQEGFWAIQYHTTQYFLSPANQRWDAAWWFVIGWEQNQAVKGGLYLATGEQNLLNLNGVHLQQAITCGLYQINCPLLFP